MSICVEVRNLSVEGLSSYKILENISLSIKCGEFVAVAGPSGGGKSTLLKILLGIRDALEGLRISGEVRVLGINVLDDGFEKLFNRVGVVLQNPVNQVFSLTVEEEVAFPLENMGLDPADIRKRVDEALNIMGLNSLRKTLVTNLSMGQIQRVVLASLIAMQPELLLLDEPCTHLDPLAKQKFYEYVYRYWRNRNITIIVIEHDLDYVLSYAGKLLVLNRRIIAYGDPIDVLSKIDVEEYGVKEPIYVKICRYLNMSIKNIDDAYKCLKSFICRNI